MEQHFCKECKHFHQHYALDSRRILRVWCGHCTSRRRIRGKQPDSPACEEFIFALPGEDAFVTKEYLSKELLQYLMKLELLPQIGELAKSE